MGNFDPTEWGDPYTKARRNVSWSVFHDVQGLINLMDGDRNFVAKLDSVFSVPNTFKGGVSRVIHEMTEIAMINMGQYAHGNQPIQHMIYLSTTMRVLPGKRNIGQELMNKLYSSGPDGYPGDEDQGRTSSSGMLSVPWDCIPFVRVPTSSMLLDRLYFLKMTIHLENGKNTHIGSCR